MVISVVKKSKNISIYMYNIEHFIKSGEREWACKIKRLLVKLYLGCLMSIYLCKTSV